MTRILALVLATAACSGGSSKGAAGAGGGMPVTPDAAIADAAPTAPGVDDVAAGRVSAGTALTLTGTVTGVTFGRNPGSTDVSTVTTDRYVLLAVSPAAGLSGTPGAWGAAAIFPGAKLMSREWALPDRGDVIEVTGTVGTIVHNLETRPVLADVSAYRVVTPAESARKQVGEACTLDISCADDLVCDRASGTCLVAQIQDWNSQGRNINGTCQTDADCPLGQTCDPGYAVKADGDYSAHYHRDRDIGRFLCQLDRAAPMETACPRVVTVDDVLGGRYPEGREVCVRGTLQFAILAEDRDTHNQGVIPAPGIYPFTEPTLDAFGFAFENVPPYKDPANLFGPIVDPTADQKLEVVGTVHYDTSHGWFELHPIKWYWVLP